MSSTYVTRVIDGFNGNNQLPNTLPPAKLEDILNLRTSLIVDSVAANTFPERGLGTHSPEDQHLIKLRIIGNLVTRLALGSHMLPSVAPFTELSEDQQISILSAVIQDYYNAADDPSSLFLNSEADPLASISNEHVRQIVHKSRAPTFAGRLALLGSYLDIRPGTFPKQPHPIPPLAQNDATFTQSFGRDSIPDSELTTIIKRREQLNHDDRAMMEHLEAISFGPGPANTALADVVGGILIGDSPNEQMIQWEVAYSLYAQHRSTFDKYFNYLHILWPSHNFYPTHEVKADSVRMARELGVYAPAELAHPDMMARALAILDRLDTVADPLTVDSGVPYNPDSVQPHVRSPRNWIPRELLARIEHMLARRIRF